MKVHKVFIVIILVLISAESHAQQYAITSAGNHKSTNSHQLTWSLGQVSNLSNTSNNIYLGAGIHTGDNLIKIVSGRSEVGQRINIYPNPVSDYMSISPSTGPYKGSYHLINVLGETILEAQEVDFSDTQVIEMHSLSNGGYVLRINIQGQPTQQFKVIKN